MASPDLHLQVQDLQSEVAALRCELAQTRQQLQLLLASERRAASRLQPRLSDPAPAFDLLVERGLHNESCFNFLVCALQRAWPAVQWQSLVET